MARAARLLSDGSAKAALEKAKHSVKRGREVLVHRQKTTSNFTVELPIPDI